MTGTNRTPLGVEAIVQALRQNTSLSNVGLSNIQTGGSYTRGRASRFDPKNPDGHYILDLSKPWDKFLAEKLHERMVAEVGENWINVIFNGDPLEVPSEGGAPELMEKKEGLLELDYVTWKRGLEFTVKLDLNTPSDKLLGEKLIQHVKASGSSNTEAIRQCKLNDVPYDPLTKGLPAKGQLMLQYFSVKAQDELRFNFELQLAEAQDRNTCLKLWERALTAPDEVWKGTTLDGKETDPTQFNYPDIPQNGLLKFEYCISLSLKNRDRGLYFSAAMSTAHFDRLTDTILNDGLQDYDKLMLVKQAASRNCFTTAQVRSLLEAVNC